jgi:hypothetical protein
MGEFYEVWLGEDNIDNEATKTLMEGKK